MSAVRKCGIVAAALCLLMLAPAAMAGPARFATIDYPGAVATFTDDINPAGDIVGGWYDSDWNEHGFLLRHGKFTSFDYPGSVWTEAYGITPDGDIVGQYGVDSVQYHGFLLRDGVFQNIDVPNPPTQEGLLPNTMPFKMSADGTVVGCFHQSDSNGNVTSTEMMNLMHGWASNDDGLGQVGWFSDEASMHTGINPEGDITGFEYGDDGVGVSYLIKDGVTTRFRFPGSSDTEAYDVNASGVVVGYEFDDAAGVYRGFVRQGSQMTSFDVAGASGGTYPQGVNEDGDIVGYYIDSDGGHHGFLMSGRGSKQ